MLWGDPLRHTCSPALHRRFAATTGVALRYRAEAVTPYEFISRARRFFAQGGWGANVTVPHKIAARELAQVLDREAAVCGAVNTLYYRGGVLRGANTDVVGLRRELLERRGLASVDDLRLAVVGAGGAARAVIVALSPHCVSVDLLVRCPQRGQALVRDLERHGIRITSVRDLATLGKNERLECSLLVDATSAWVRGDEWGLPSGSLSPGAVFYTLSYGKEADRFQRLARQHGADACIDGWGLLVEQAAASFALWTGVFPPTDELCEAGIAGLEK